MFEPLESQLRERREQLGLSQGEVARRAGVGRAQYAALEAGKANITLGFLLKVTGVLGLPAVMVKGQGVYSSSPDLAALVRAQDAIARTRALLAGVTDVTAELDDIAASIDDIIAAPIVPSGGVAAAAQHLTKVPAKERERVGRAIRDVAQTQHVDRQKRPTREETANRRSARKAE